MKTNNPVTHEEKVFDQLSVNFCVATRPDISGGGIAVNLTLTKMHKTEQGECELLPREIEVPLSVLFGNIKTQGGSSSLTALVKIQTAIQEFIDTENL